jgi:hypothetical protein
MYGKKCFVGQRSKASMHGGREMLDCVVFEVVVVVVLTHPT